MIINHDLHMHTQISNCCKDKNQTLANIKKNAAKIGLDTIGITNHFWDKAAFGGGGFNNETGSTQDYNTLAKVFEEDCDCDSVRVLLGCETDYRGNGIIGITEETAERLDYVTVASSHLHLIGFTRMKNVTSPQAVSEMMMTNIEEIIEYDFVDIIAHPATTHLDYEFMLNCHKCLTDDRLKRCFDKVAKTGVSLEITPANLTKKISPRHNKSFYDYSINYYKLALAAGCVFTLGSDSHHTNTNNSILELSDFLDEVGIKNENIHEMVRKK